MTVPVIASVINRDLVESFLMPMVAVHQKYGLEIELSG